MGHGTHISDCPYLYPQLVDFVHIYSVNCLDFAYICRRVLFVADANMSPTGYRSLRRIFPMCQHNALISGPTYCQHLSTFATFVNICHITKNSGCAATHMWQDADLCYCDDQSSRNVKKLTGHLVLQSKNFAGPDKILQDRFFFSSKSKELYSLKKQSLL